METFTHPYVGRGRATLAIRVSDNVIDVGVSFCSPNDQFSRSKGRIIALDRLNTKSREKASNLGFFMTAERNTARKPDEQARDMLAAVITTHHVPRWATDAAGVRLFDVHPQPGRIMERFDVPAVLLDKLNSRF